MTQISAKVVADSIDPDGNRLTTLQLCYPRFIHAEFMTHRVFSRNAMSSRAVPVAKMIEQVRNDPAMPVHWGKNQPGMQAREELTGYELARAQNEWRGAANDAAFRAERMNTVGAHKQVVNRILEPFQWMHTIVTATEWQNFFELRCHPAAEPNMQPLAYAMRDAIQGSTPVALKPGQWHLPYITREEGYIAANGEQVFPISGSVLNGSWSVERLIKCSVARCARVSYLTHDGQAPSIEKDVALHDQLVGSVPMHASPAEHQATPDSGDWPWYRGNFHRGWIQYRKVLEAGPGVTEYFTHHYGRTA